MKKGHVFTIEPMINMGNIVVIISVNRYWPTKFFKKYKIRSFLLFFSGTWRDEVWPDNWTAVTQVCTRRAVARMLIGGGGMYIYIFMFCPTDFFSN